VHVRRAASHDAVASGGPSRAHCAMTPSTEGSGSSPSSSSSSDDQCEFHELVCAVNEARQRYSDATHEVGHLERCLDVIRVALEASERETAFTHAVAADAWACIVGKGDLGLVVPFVVRCS
jgi:hypothetical protein